MKNKYLKFNNLFIIKFTYKYTIYKTTTNKIPSINNIIVKQDVFLKDLTKLLK